MLSSRSPICIITESRGTPKRRLNRLSTFHRKLLMAQFKLVFKHDPGDMPVFPEHQAQSQDMDK
ncbi:hypothetical protein PGT21_021592 [Puccinia graminis f. sp. tritici]|uniref:Uncharacterized protein n=1 Tax=Puccinia graminis f. sp. tritici TaxID=56615 RepID=A0A5B0N952_PUCGR|nr:hypothetical protein PGT21_021592 [Puccinia graminis f. sp. tritici]KAA1090365.1 hypothetical protein PGTUg99_001909 [Puccinia graminis f. sp. tritici]